MSKDTSGKYYQRLSCTGHRDRGRIIRRPGNHPRPPNPGTGPNSTGSECGFSILANIRSALVLLLLNGVVYNAWASHCDIDPYNGWIMGFQRVDVSNVERAEHSRRTARKAPSGMSGGGLAADSFRQHLFSRWHGTFDTTLNPSGFPSQGDFGNAFLKLSTTGGLAVADYFQRGPIRLLKHA